MNSLPVALLKVLGNAFTIVAGSPREMQDQHTKVCSAIGVELERRSSPWMLLTIGKPCRGHGTGKDILVLWKLVPHPKHDPVFELAPFDSERHLRLAKAWSTIPRSQEATIEPELEKV